jgi:hypothetical protein
MERGSDNALAVRLCASVVFAAKKRSAPYENMQKTPARTLECAGKSISMLGTSEKARFQLVIFHF